MNISDLGTRLKKYRRKHKMTQNELSILLHLTRQAVSNYESGIRVPDIFTLWLIADIFKISVDELIGRESIKPIKPLKA